jgi:hypothetical protein
LFYRTPSFPFASAVRAQLPHFFRPEPRSFHSGRGLDHPQRATPAAAARHAFGARSAPHNGPNAAHASNLSS